MRITVKIKRGIGINDIKTCNESGIDFEIKVNAIREKNKANIKIIELISEYYSINKNQVKIISGLKNSIKIIEIV